jgi:hypothetical protein
MSHSASLNESVLRVSRNNSKQNVVHFLAETDEHFHLKNVSDSVRLSMAMKAVTDNNANQCFTAVSKDFRQEFTELLWRQPVQSRVRCALHQDRYDREREYISSFP